MDGCTGRKNGNGTDAMAKTWTDKQWEEQTSKQMERLTDKQRDETTGSQKLVQTIEGTK